MHYLQPINIQRLSSGHFGVKSSQLASGDRGALNGGQEARWHHSTSTRLPSTLLDHQICTAFRLAAAILSDHGEHTGILHENLANDQHRFRAERVDLKIRRILYREILAVPFDGRQWIAVEFDLESCLLLLERSARLYLLREHRRLGRFRWTLNDALLSFRFVLHLGRFRGSYLPGDFQVSFDLFLDLLLLGYVHLAPVHRGFRRLWRIPSFHALHIDVHFRRVRLLHEFRGCLLCFLNLLVLLVFPGNFSARLFIYF